MKLSGVFLLLSLALFCFFSEIERDVAREISHRTENDFVLATIYLGQVFKAEYTGQKSHFDLKEKITKFISSQIACEKDNALNLEMSVRGDFPTQLLQSVFSQGRQDERAWITRSEGRLPCKGGLRRHLFKIDCGEFGDPMVYCTRESNPHCGSDGQTYGNKCAFCKAMVKSGGKINLKHYGKC